MHVLESEFGSYISIPHSATQRLKVKIKMKTQWMKSILRSIEKKNRLKSDIRGKLVWQHKPRYSGVLEIRIIYITLLLLFTGIQDTGFEKKNCQIDELFAKSRQIDDFWITHDVQFKLRPRSKVFDLVHWSDLCNA